MTARQPTRRPMVCAPVVWMTLFLTLAFTPILGGGAVMSEGATPSRVIELALVGVALTIGLFCSRRVDLGGLPPAALQPFFLGVAFALWAMFGGIFSQLIVTAIAKACELLAVILSAYLAVVRVRAAPSADEVLLTNSLAAGLGAAIVILLAANVILHGTPIPLMQGDPNDPFESFVRARFYLGNSHPLTTGAVLALAIVLIANSSIRSLRKLAFIVPLAVLLRWADARAVTGGCILAIIVTGYLQLRSQSVRSFVGAAAGTIFASVNLIFLMFGSWSVLAGSVIGKDVFTLDGRTELWSFAIRKALDMPVLGIGYFNTRIVLLPEFSFAGQSHNSLIEALLGTGVLGFTLALLFLVLAIRAACATRSRLLAGILLTILLDSMLNPELFTPSLPMFLLTAAAIEGGTLGRFRHSIRRTGAARWEYMPHSAIGDAGLGT